jgi:putative spermidine/putrescine transport system ATP-binding protein
MTTTGWTGEPTPIQLIGCRKTFPGGTIAVSGIDLSIAAGETLALLGPSGCGKTTTLRMIAGFDMPDPGGRVLFGTEDVTIRPVEQRDVGMVFQSYALFPNMNVAQNVEYGLRVRRLQRAHRQARVEEMLTMMRIADLRDRRIGQLSGGQRQRVALARAIAIRPRILLLDEPLAALDAKLRDQVRVEIGALLKSLRITAVFVTHDQAEAMALGDRIVVMNQGAVEQIGKPQEIFRTPRTAFVADFVGTMNALEGKACGGLAHAAGLTAQFDVRDGDVQLMFRPHDATLVAISDGHLRGIVISQQYAGEKMRSVVQLEHGKSIIVDSSPELTIAAGTSVGITVQPQRLLAFPTER